MRLTDMHIGTGARSPRLSEVDPLSRQSYATPSTPLGHERLGAYESCPPIEEFRMCEWAAQPHARVHRQQKPPFGVSIQATSRQDAFHHLPAHVACALGFLVGVNGRHARWR